MNYGKNIIRLRIEHQMTQQELADKISITREMLYRYEYNIVKRPSYEVLASIAFILGVTIKDLEEDNNVNTTTFKTNDL